MECHARADCHVEAQPLPNGKYMDLKGTCLLCNGEDIFPLVTYCMCMCGGNR